jgi:Lon protease-like protein
MQQELLPLFPLQMVLLPNAQLALHIFEDRYKEMIGEAIQHKTEFGIVLANEKGIVNTGCTAMVQRVVQRYEDGRLDIIATGRRRFEILLLNEEKDYLRGAVQFFDDEDTQTPSPEAVAKVEAGFEELQRLEPGPEQELSGPAAPFSFQVAQSVPDLNFRQLLLAMRSEAERIQRLADYLPTVLAKMRIVAHVRAVAPSNGHATHTGF